MTKSKNLISLVLLLSICLLSFSSCSGVSIDTPVDKNGVNISAENVCRGFFESLYNNDKEMFYSCFYEGSMDIEDGQDVFDMYQDLVDPELEFLGTKHIATRPCNIDNGYDYDIIKDNISVFNGIDDSKIEDIKLVNIKVFFKLGDENKSVELFSTVYLADNAWYFFSIMDTTERTVKK